jgi:hypothetical protein
MELEQRQRVRLATVAILAMVLGAGFLLGAAWDRRLDAETVPFGSADSVAATPARRGQDRAPMYTLVSPALTAEQMAAADEIVAHRREAARALLAEPSIDSLYDAMKSAEKTFKETYDPRFRQLIEASRAGIREIMTPEQAAQYDSLLADFDRKRRGGGDSD